MPEHRLQLLDPRCVARTSSQGFRYSLGGLSKEDLHVADEFDAKWESTRAMIRSDPATAIQRIGELLATIDRHPLLEHNREDLQRGLGEANMVAGNRPAAMKIYEQLLQTEPGCKPKATYPAACGEAQMDLAVVKMMSADVPGALSLEQAAAANFRNQLSLETPRELDGLQHYVHLCKLGEAQAYSAILLAGPGKVDEARRVLDECVTALGKVFANTEVQPNLRNEAQRYLDLAKLQQSKLK
jgi:tetratricopeptide (TPR) repeat protein